MKQMIVLRKDLNMRKGKMVAQGAHASSRLCMDLTIAIAEQEQGKPNDTPPSVLRWFVEWTKGNYAKICVGVDSLDDLLALKIAADKAGVATNLVMDAGLTEFKQPTVTALAIGPAPDDVINPLTGHLKLL